MATAAIAYDEPSAPGPLAATCQVESVEGFASVLSRLEDLSEIVRDTPQHFELQDVPYFLDRPQRLRVKPHLLLFYGGSQQTLVGGVLLIEFQRIFLSVDSKGRRCIFAPKQIRVELAAMAAEFLFARGARFVNIDVDLDLAEPTAIARRNSYDEGHALAGQRLQQHGKRTLEWSLHTLFVHTHMPLTRDFDAALAPLGRKARKNLRRYGRLAQRELGCRFEPNAALSLEEFDDLAAHSHYPVAGQAVLWRYRSLHRFANTFCCGLQSASGKWLAVAGCRRNGNTVEIDWQMNRKGFETYSLVTALRSAFIEYECGRGTSRFRVDSGELHQMADSYPRNAVYNLAVRRPGSLLLGCMRLLLPRILPLHFLTTSLLREGRVWTSDVAPLRKPPMREVSRFRS